MKRYCQTLELVGDSYMIESYIEAHRHVWPKSQEGIRSVGILDIVGSPLDVPWCHASISSPTINGGP